MVQTMSKRLATFLLVAAFVLSLFGSDSQPSTAAAQQVVIPEEILLENNFRVIFDGVEYHTDGTSTWNYTVEELPEAKDLSNWVLETPFCAPILDANPEPWEIVDPDPNAQLSGVKWETGDGFVQGQFWVRLDTTGQVGVTNVAAKGPGMAWGVIAGPSCVEGEPPGGPPVAPGDAEPPTIEWIEPVGEQGTYDLPDGGSVDLVVVATDNFAVDRVEFIRWDAIGEAYVPMAVDEDDPFQITVSASELNPTWNQVFAASFDEAGNQSGWLWIWLYVVTNEPLFQPTNTTVFIPFIQR